MNTALEVERQHVILGDESVVVFDYKDGTYRLVLYRRRRAGERNHQVGAANFDNLVRQRVLPHGYHTGWARFATFNTDLTHALRDVIERAATTHDADVVNDYIRAAPWGRDLP